MNPYRISVRDEIGFREVAIFPHLYGNKFLQAQADYARKYYKFPVHLVLSSIPYKALCVLGGGDGIPRVEVSEFHGMKVIHLDTWEEEIIIVG